MSAGKIIFLVLLLCIFVGATDSVHARDHLLFRIERYIQFEVSGFRLIFSGIPEFEVETSGQRLDVILHQTKLADSFVPLQADQDLARILIVERSDRTIVSMVLRRPPEDVEYSTSFKDQTLELKATWPEGRELSRPSFSSSLDGVLTVSQDGLTLKRVLFSEYAGNWEQFFREFELPLSIGANQHYTMAPLAALVPSADMGLLPGRALKESGDGRWEEALRILRKSFPSDRNVSRHLPQTVLEAKLYFRLGQMKHGRDAVHKLLRQNDGYQATAKYLQAYGAAVAGDPDKALLLSDELARSGHPGQDLRPFADLLRLEAALSTGREDMALDIVRDLQDQEFPAEDVLLLRQAQAELALGRQEKAEKILKKFSYYTFYKYPRVLELWARHSYKSGDYGFALSLFVELAHVLSDREKKAMAEFAAATAMRHVGSLFMARHSLERIIEQYPDTLARWRAQIVLADLELLERKNPDFPRLFGLYDESATEAQCREVREEAAFKLILAAYIGNRPKLAAQLLGPFMRQFHAGELYPHAQVLLLELLPGVVKELMVQEAYVQALSLVQRHRETLVHATLPLNFLQDLGDAFFSFGLYDQAVQVYEYMMALMSDSLGKEDIYPKLIQSYLSQEKFERTESTAQFYLDNFHTGKYRKQVYALWVKALHESGRNERAIRALQAPDRPVSRELDMLAGEIFYSEQNYTEAERYLARSMAGKWRAAPEEKIMQRAESLFFTGDYEQALDMYSHLIQKGYQVERSLYRKGQALIESGRTGQGTKLLTQLTEKEGNTLWKVLSREVLAIHDLR